MAGSKKPSVSQQLSKLLEMDVADIASLPSLFVINSEGMILYSHTGYSPGDEKELDAILETLK